MPPAFPLQPLLPPSEPKSLSDKMFRCPDFSPVSQPDSPTAAAQEVGDESGYCLILPQSARNCEEYMELYTFYKFSLPVRPVVHTPLLSDPFPLKSVLWDAIRILL